MPASASRRICSVDLMQRRFGCPVEPFRQSVQDVGGLVDPTPLLSGVGKHVSESSPESKGAITNGDHRCVHSSAFEVSEDFGRNQSVDSR